MATRGMMLLRRGLFAAGALIGLAAPAAAAPPGPWEINLQPAASPIMEMIHRFNDGVVLVAVLITLFVLALLIYVVMRFNARANPVPSRVSHNTLIEVIWTVVPILILVGIAVPSFALLFAEHDPARAIDNYDPSKTLTVKVTGTQWFWTYEYPDNGDLSFDSNMLQDNEITDPATQPRLLSVDNAMVVPTDTVIRVQVIGADVIHAFAVPAFGVKIDAVPGRLNETWFRVDHEGMYYGQCSELCGQSRPSGPNDLHGHAFMPIVVHAVSPDKFKAWAAMAGSDLDGANKLLAEMEKTPPSVDVAANAK